MYRSGLIELEAVLAVARRRSFRSAAIELGLSTSSLSSAVARLESRLGVRLFNRTTRSVAPTEAGQAFIARVSAAVTEINGAIEAVNTHRQTLGGSLRIYATSGAARMVFAPIVLEYLRRYPQVHVDIVTDNRGMDVVAGGFDAGILRGDFIPKDMIAMPMGPALRPLVVGSTGYFAKHPQPRVPTDLMSHECIRFRMPSGAVQHWEFVRGEEAANLDVPGTLTINDSALMLEVVRAGLGIAMFADWYVKQDIAAGRLVPVLSDWMQPYPGISLYYPANRHIPTPLRALIDLVREIFTRKTPRVIRSRERRRPAPLRRKRNRSGQGSSR